LDAVLYPDGLGKFKDQNGAGNDGSQWESQPLTYCQWSGETLLSPNVPTKLGRANKTFIIS
jgi:hypothetical protein